MYCTLNGIDLICTTLYLCRNVHGTLQWIINRRYSSVHTSISIAIFLHHSEPS